MTLSISTTGVVPVKATPNNPDELNDEIVEVKEEQKSIYEKYREVAKKATEKTNNDIKCFNDLYKYIESNKDLIGMDYISFLKKYYPNLDQFVENTIYDIRDALIPQIQLLRFSRDNNVDLKLYYVEDVFLLDKSSCETIKKNISNVINDSKDNKEDFQTKIAEAGQNYKIEKICKHYDISKKHVKNVDNFLKAVKYVEDNELSTGLVSIKEARQHILDYSVALNYSWDCVEDFVKFNSSANDSDNLIQRLVKKNLLKRKINYTKSEVKEACRKYFKLFETMKMPNDDAHKNMTQEEWQRKLFRQTLGKLLINSYNHCSVFKRGFIIPIIESIKEEYMDEAVQNAFTLADGDEQSTKQLSNDTLKSKVVRENISQQTLVQAGSKASQEVLDDVKDEAAHTYIELGNDKSVDPEVISRKKAENIKLNEAEKKYDAAQNVTSSLMIASVLNESIDQEEEKRTNAILMTEIQEKAPENSYRLLLKNIDNYVDISKVSDDKKVKLTKYFNRITNNNFSRIIENPCAELNPPVDIEALKSENDNIGIKPKEDVDISVNVEKSSLIKKQIEEQTTAAENPEEEKFSVENTSQVDVVKSNPSNSLPGGTLPTCQAVLRNVTAISVADIKTFSIGLAPLLKQFSELSNSVQNHIKTRLESKSEDEQVQSIDQMDKNSDKVDIALQLKISEDKLKELHLDTNARKCLELHEDVA